MGCPLGLLGATRVGQQLQCLLVVVGGLVGTADRARLVTGADARGQCRREVHRKAGVAGQLGGRAAGAALAERRGVRLVQPDPLAGQEVVVDRLAQEGVPEQVALLVREQDVHLDGLAQSLVQTVGVEAGGLAEHVVGDAAAGDAGRAHHLAGLVVEPVEADQQHVGELRRDPATGTEGGPDELLDEERVALGPAHDVGDLVLLEMAGVQLVDEGADIGRLQWLELEALDAADPRPLRHLRPERVPSVEVVGAVRRHHGHRPVEGAGEQEAEHVAGRPVGPVGVLDDQEHRGLLGGRLEEEVHGLEQVGAVEGRTVARLVGAEHAAAGLEPAERRVDAGDVPDHIGEIVGQSAEHLGEREVRERAVAEVKTVPGEHLPALGVGQVAELGEEPGLADPGVAGQQNGPGRDAVGVRTDAEHRSKLRQLGVPSHQGLAGMPRHGAHHVAFADARAHGLARVAGLDRAAHPGVAPRTAHGDAGLDPLGAVVQLGLQVGAGDVVHGGFAPRVVVDEYEIRLLR
jgi:hypothetical protein